MNTNKNGFVSVLKNNKGFTLLEMLVVIGIIAILAAIVVPNIMSNISHANAVADRMTAQQLSNAAFTHFEEYREYPVTNDLVTVNDPQLEALIKAELQAKGVDEAVFDSLNGVAFKKLDPSKISEYVRLKDSKINNYFMIDNTDGINGYANELSGVVLSSKLYTDKQGIVSSGNIIITKGREGSSVQNPQLAPPLGSITLEKGSSVGSFKITELPSGSYYYAVGSENSMNQPHVGDNAFEQGYVSSLILNDDIGINEGDAVFIVQVDTDGAILGWEKIIIQGQYITQVAKLVVGTNTSFALLDNGNVLSWGKNNYGQLGLGDHDDRYTPTLIPSISNIVDIVPGIDSIYAITSDKTVYAWGRNQYGQLGLGDNINRNVPALISGLTNVKQLSASNHVLALLEDGTIRAWGDNGSSQLGLGISEYGSNKQVPMSVAGISNVKKVSAGGNFSAAILNNGHVYTWGSNNNGQLGLSDTSPRYTPTIISSSGVIDIVANGASLYLLRNDGSLYATGLNLYGQLGVGDTTNRKVPVSVKTSELGVYLKDVKKVIAGGGSVFAIREDGSLYGWGSDYAMPFHYNQNRALKLNDENVEDVIFAGTHGFIILENGKIKAFGKNLYGELGVGYTSPDKVVLWMESSFPN